MAGPRQIIQIELAPIPRKDRRLKNELIVILSRPNADVVSRLSPGLELSIPSIEDINLNFKSEEVVLTACLPDERAS